MTAVLPPIVCRYPFANDEISAFCDDIERELAAKAGDLTLAPVRLMREFLSAGGKSRRAGSPE
jgi:hypothetical protein